MKIICQWSVIITAVLSLSACQSKSVVIPVVPALSVSPAPVEVVHTSRYTLTSLTPEEALRYPLRQIASHIIPAPKKYHKPPTRGDALKIWLSGTGYALCQAVTDDVTPLFNSPLPDSQRAITSLRTETALQIIAGSAWVMSVDEMTRVVCFSRAPAIQNLS
ncbi:TPA: hypothetical protein JAN03_16550 [Citrobacter freundii]|nr:hypothetical protein [Citrobacter freundii]